MKKEENKQPNFIPCPDCKGRGKLRKKLRKKVRLIYKQELDLFEKTNGKGTAPIKPRGHLYLCPNCSGSGLVQSINFSEVDKENYPHLAIIGGGIGGVALAVACMHRGIPFTLYERDSGFDTRSQGYGLTLQQASKAIDGFGIFSLKDGVVSTRHAVHTTDGTIIGSLDIAIQEEAFQNELKKTEGGKWMLENWSKISLVSSLGIMSIEIARGLIKHGDELVDIIKKSKHTDQKVADEINELIDVAKKKSDELGRFSDDQLKFSSKLSRQYKKFINKWKGKNIANLTRKEIADNLKGFTEQGNKVAKGIEDESIIIVILDEKAFKQEYLLAGGKESSYSGKNFKTEAFSVDDINYFKNTKPIDEFMSEIVHEGTHTLDYLEKSKLIKDAKKLNDLDMLTELKRIEKQFGNLQSYEKRAFFHERAFQEATGMIKDYNTIENMLKFIKVAYK